MEIGRRDGEEEKERERERALSQCGGELAMQSPLRTSHL